MEALGFSTLSRRSILCASFNSFAAWRLAAQQSATFSAEVNVVNILGTVRDQNGQLIEDLSKDGFNVLEDGHPQVIRYFSSKTDVPLTIALLVDTSLSQQHLLEAEGHTVGQFLRHILRPEKDTSPIVRFDHDIRILQDFSSVPVDTDALFENLTNPNYRAAGTHLHGAVYSISRQKLSSKQAEK
jgi:VWFA-related protein